MKVDLTDTAAVNTVLEREKPDFIIHAAAERFPDKVEKQYEQTRQLNINASGSLTSIASN